MDRNHLHSFLAERLQILDALLIDNVVANRQDITARIVHAYSSRFEGPVKYESGRIDFVGTGGAWGNSTLTTNDKALVFVGNLGNRDRYYQHHSWAHFLIKLLNGKEYAVVPGNNGHNNWWPASFHDQCVVPDSKRPWEVAVPYSLLESCLKQVINEQIA